MASKKALKKASGRNISEGERNTERLSLRLEPFAMAYIEQAAEKMGCTKSTVVLMALRALDVVRQDKGEVMSWGTCTNAGMVLMNRTMHIDQE